MGCLSVERPARKIQAARRRARAAHGNENPHRSMEAVHPRTAQNAVRVSRIGKPLRVFALQENPLRVATYRNCRVSRRQGQRLVEKRRL
ncbi:hypothetical protein [Xanthomonas sp. GW]|uniref:hypothetical protein n=1 Tax=Xanthomonas sp. GW TaxID=2724121 RepID=UPI00163B5651|nr:hypothetical protein [Xanthomonas sp. GW]